MDCPEGTRICNKSNVGFGIVKCCDEDGIVVTNEHAPHSRHQHLGNCADTLDFPLIQMAHDNNKFPPCRALVAMCHTYHNGDVSKTKSCTEASSNPGCRNESDSLPTCKYKPLRTPHEYPMINWASHAMRKSMYSEPNAR